MSVLEKFLDYVKYDTQSDPESGAMPSTAKQKVLAAHLVKEMKKIGIEDAHTSEFGYVYGTVPATAPRAQTVGFIAHMDTAPDFSGAGVQPRVIENYDGSDIVLNEALGIVTTVEQFPRLQKHIGQTLVVTDGTTLLGADDKAGVAEILQAAEELIQSGEPHGAVKIAFTPDEEIGAGPSKFDVPHFGADFAFTVDGGTVNDMEYENFNGASAKVHVKGLSVHPGGAKGKMINASRVAMEFNSLLPQTEVPENTEGYEGFWHLLEMHTSIESADLNYIIRDHDYAKLCARKEKFTLAAEFINKKYGRELVTLDIRDSYRNMKEQLEPHPEILEIAREAIRENGLEPTSHAIRGGTDGATLSFMGLPCPNLGTGGENAHGKYEYAVVEDMETMVRILKTIVRLVK